MKALVVFGSKHGSTKKIAEEISSMLKNEGFDVHMANAEEEIHDVEQFDLAVVGSAVYLGSWLKEPTEFVRKNQAILKDKPVWFFTCGLHPEDARSVNPKAIVEFKGTIGPRDHQFFSGSLDPNDLGRLHRMLIRLPGMRSRLPTGDFRSGTRFSFGRKGLRCHSILPTTRRKKTSRAAPRKAEQLISWPEAKR